MARTPNHRFEKQKREQLRAARAAARRQRKLENAASTRNPQTRAGEDPDLAGIVPGPQPRNEPTAAEAQRAVQRAMNPGAVLPGDGERAVRAAQLFVGNLDFAATDAELRSLFVKAGFKVENSNVVTDRATGQPRGFAFVEVQGLKEGGRAVRELDGVELHGRPLRVSVADKPPR